MAKYDHLEENEWVIPVKKNYKLACCDCGLVHNIDFTHTLLNGEVRIAFRVRRNNRATGQVRRHAKIKVITKYIGDN